MTEIRAAERDQLASLGPYDLEQQLGSGGEAVVYLATDRRLHRQVAVKVLHQPADESTMARLREELSLVSKLDHPRLCTIHDVGSVGAGTAFVIMRYVTGQTLRERLAQAKAAGEEAPPALHAASEATTTTTQTRPDSLSLSSRSFRGRVEATLDFFEKAARAIHVAHEAGVIHGDLKPSNFMIHGDPGAIEPVILDFGFASRTTEAKLHGTPHYMAPELIREQGERSPAIDVFGLGVSLYETLAQQLPFDGPTRESIFRSLVSDPTPTLPDSIRASHAELDVVLQKALDKDPGRRYRSAEAFAEDLARVRQRQPVAAQRPSTSRRIWLWTERNPIAAVLLVLIAGGVILTAWSLTQLLAQMHITETALHRKREANEELRVATVRAELLNAAQTVEELEDSARSLAPMSLFTVADYAAWLRRRSEVVDQVERRLADFHALPPEPDDGEVYLSKRNLLRRVKEPLAQQSAQIAAELQQTQRTVVWTSSEVDGYPIRTAALGDIDRDGTRDFTVCRVSRKAKTFERRIGTIVVYSGRSRQALSRWRGFDVAPIDDINGDGVPEILLGDPADLSGRVLGLARIHSGTDGAILRTFTTESESDLNVTVLGLPDLDRDGIPEILVGSPSTQRAGTTRVYSGRTGQLLRTHRGNDPGDRFGHAIAVLGDLDEDEVADYAIGADRANASGTQSGQVTIYSGATGKPLRRIPGFAAWSGFGWSIAPLGDLDRDGSPDFAVGADWENHGKWDRAGCVRVFSGRDGQVLHTHYGSGPKRLFGFAIATAGDVDRDGHLDLAVHSSGSRHSDALRIISGRTGAALASYPGKGWFGYSMALLGDVTANGHADLLVANHTAGFVSILEGAQLVRPPGR